MFIGMGLVLLFFIGGFALWALVDSAKHPFLAEGGKILFMAGAFALAFHSNEVALAMGFRHP
jgi:hypothetical protein